MARHRKRRAPEGAQLNQESSKRVRRSEKEPQKQSRPSFLEAKTMVKIHVSDRIDSDSEESDDKGGNDANESQREAETFIVHKAFICRYSPFFDAAFNGNFEEGKTQDLRLRDTDPAAFSIFMDWLYTQKVTPIKSDDNEVIELDTLLELWILADKLLIPRLQNETLRVFDERRSSLGRLASNSCHYVYSNTAEGSPLRRYVSYLASRRLEAISENKILAYSACWPREMLVDMLKEMRNSAGKLRRETRLSQDELQKFFVPEDDERRTQDS